MCGKSQNYQQCVLAEVWVWYLYDGMMVSIFEKVLTKFKET